MESITAVENRNLTETRRDLDCYKSPKIQYVYKINCYMILKEALTIIVAVFCYKFLFKLFSLTRCLMFSS